MLEMMPPAENEQEKPKTKKTEHAAEKHAETAGVPEAKPHEAHAHEKRTSAELEELKKELETAKADAESNLNGWKRAQADFINFKRRTEVEKEETIKYCTTGLITNILPVLDDFARAEAAIPQDKDNSRFLDGMKMVERKLRNFLEGQGIAEIKTEGEMFDPNLHEAVMQMDGEEGMIIKEFEKGYKLYDRVIRASKVAVGNGNIKEDTVEKKEE
jgi:molecular chaperone GrpE